MCEAGGGEPREDVEKDWAGEGAWDWGGAGDGKGSSDRGCGGRTEGGGSWSETKSMSRNAVQQPIKNVQVFMRGGPLKN